MERTINILGEKYKIRIDTRKKLKLNEKYQGITYTYEKKIDVCSDIDESLLEEVIDMELCKKNMIKETLLHELIHAYLYEAGYVTESSDESLVETFSVLIPKIINSFTMSTDIPIF